MSIIKLIFVDTILDMLYFPVWWYSRGLVLASKWILRSLLDAENFLGIRIWAANLFKPMFGQADWQGKIISFFMRVFQIIFRSIIFLGISIFHCALLVLYLLLPLIVVYFIIWHLTGLLFKYS